MREVKPKTIFFAKTWFHHVGALMCSSLALFCLVLGPLFLFGVVKDAHGRPAADAGVALCIAAVPMCLLALLLWFNVHARCRPLLRICRDGIEVNVIGSSSLDGVPLVPVVLRIAWAILSLQGFKQQIAWIPWSLFRGVHVHGPPMVRTMVIEGTIIYPTFIGDQVTAKLGDLIAFRDAEFDDQLDAIASAIQSFHAHPDARELLPSLHD